MTAQRNPEPNPARPEQSGKNSLRGVRLRKHADYQVAYSASRKHQSSSMSWFLAPRISEAISGASPDAASTVIGPRVGLTAGKVLGKAHERNRIKRRMRDVLRRHVDLLPANADLILHPRRTVLTMDFAKLEAEIVRILSQARAELLRTESQARAEAAKTEASKAAGSQ
jgi:ribonuclease P protein component